MGSPLLLRQALLLRVCFHNYQRFTAGAVVAPHRPWCSAASSLSSEEAHEKTNSGSISNSSFARKPQFPSRQSRWEDDPDYRKWKDKEEEILRDIEPIVMLAKDILHTRRSLLNFISTKYLKWILFSFLICVPHTAGTWMERD